MAQQTINIGASPNDGTGTPLRTAFQYTNSNFSELYTAVGPSGNNIVVPGSATITGDLTVDTSTLKVDSANDRVGVGTATPSHKLEVATLGSDTRVRINSTSVVCTEYFRSGTGLWLVGSDSTNAFKIARGSNFGGSADYFAIAAATADCTWYDGAGGTRMTLNSTGLGVGRSPSYRLQASSGTKATTASLATVAGITTTDVDDFGIYFRLKTDATGANRYAAITSFDNGSGNGARDLVLQDLGGNVGIGVTPSAWRNTQRALQIGAVGAYFSSAASTGSTAIGRNVYESAAGNFTYIVNDEATFYEQTATGVHAWYSAAAGTGTISFGDAKMTLDASGRLILLASTTTPATLNTNGQLTFTATSDTNLRFSYRGSDGTTRVANITLA